MILWLRPSIILPNFEWCSVETQEITLEQYYASKTGVSNCLSLLPQATLRYTIAIA